MLKGVRMAREPAPFFKARYHLSSAHDEVLVIFALLSVNFSFALRNQARGDRRYSYVKALQNSELNIIPGSLRDWILKVYSINKHQLAFHTSQTNIRKGLEAQLRVCISSLLGIG